MEEKNPYEIKNWRQIYAGIVLFLLFQIIFYYFFTETFK